MIHGLNQYPLQVFHTWGPKMGKFGKMPICKNCKITHIKQFFLTLLQRSSRKPLACLHRATYQLLKAKINWMEKLKYEGQGHGYKFSIFKNVKIGIFS